MTEPRIQYAKTSDGVNIAFWTLGERMPLVSIQHRGEFVPKGFDDAVRLYEVRWREEGAETS